MHQDQPQRVVSQATPMEETITAAKPATVETADDAMTWKTNVGGEQLSCCGQ